MATVAADCGRLFGGGTNVNSRLETDGDSTGKRRPDEQQLERRLRLRKLFVAYRRHLLVAFVLVILLGGWLSYTAYAAPATETDEQLEHRWTATGGFSHEATVAESTSLYDAGDVLEDQPLYYTSITPELEGEFVGGYHAETGDDVEVTLEVDLYYRSVDASEETVYWSERESLAATSETGVEPGELVAAPFTLNVSALDDRIDDIESELGASPGETKRGLEVTREVTGMIDGEHRTASDQYQIPITDAGSAYDIDDAESYDEPDETTEMVTVPASEGDNRSTLGLVFVALGLLGAVGTWIGDSRVQKPTPDENEWLTYRSDRAEFEDMITAAELPPSALEGEHAYVESLAALTALGIDSGEPVRFDQRSGQYVVTHDGLCYIFEPPVLTSDSADEPLRGDDPTDGIVIYDSPSTMAHDEDEADGLDDSTDSDASADRFTMDPIESGSASAESSAADSAMADSRASTDAEETAETEHTDANAAADVDAVLEIHTTNPSIANLVSERTNALDDRPAVLTAEEIESMESGSEAVTSPTASTDYAAELDALAFDVLDEVLEEPHRVTDDSDAAAVASDTNASTQE